MVSLGPWTDFLLVPMLPTVTLGHLQALIGSLDASLVREERREESSMPWSPSTTPLLHTSPALNGAQAVAVACRGCLQIKRYSTTIGGIEP